MKNLFENYTNKFGITKTIRMGLKPVPETQKIISQNGILEIDKKRAEYYKVVKSIIDRKHKSFIEINLNNFKLDDTLKEFYELYRITNKNDTEIKSIKSCEENLRKQIANHFKSNAKFDRLFKKELIEEDIWDFAETDYEKDAISAFCNGFTTYFINFNTNRKNMYSAEEKSTAISFRIINQNLPKFIDNIIAFEKIEKSDLSNDFGELTDEFSDLLGFSDIKDVFNEFDRNSFDVVVTNPPYKKQGTGINAANEKQQISRFETSVDLAEWIKIASNLINSKGSFYMVYRTDRLGELIEELNKNKLAVKRIRFVHSKISEQSNLVLLKATKNGGTFVTVEKPLIRYNEDGSYTDEIMTMYNKGKENS